MFNIILIIIFSVMSFSMNDWSLTALPKRDRLFFSVQADIGRIPSRANVAVLDDFEFVS